MFKFLSKLFGKINPKEEEDFSFDESVRILAELQNTINKMILEEPKEDLKKIQNDAIYMIFTSLDYDLLKEDAAAKRAYMEIKKYLIDNNIFECIE